MRCKRKTVCILWMVAMTLFSIESMKGQAASTEPLRVDIRVSRINEQIVSHVLKIINSTDVSFNGAVKLDLPTDIRSLSSEMSPITLAPGDSTFVPFRLVVGKEVGAGRKRVCYSILDETRSPVMEREAFIEIEQREQLFLHSDEAPVMLLDPRDSVRVTVTVTNRGNIREEIALVFNIPNLQGAPAFTEVTAELDPMEQQQFMHSFPASANLLSSVQFPVHVTAMRGKEKTIFGNRTVTVQNVFSNRSFVDIHPAGSPFISQGSTDNSVTLSYRQYNQASSMMQLQGGAYLDLPAGYLHLKGNIYKYSSSNIPMVTNTSLMYKLHENEFTVGSVSEQTELSLYGRGAKAMFSDKSKSKRLTVGAVDQNFNLVDSRPWFTDFYSFYAQGELGVNNREQGARATYVYQKNPYEKAVYNVGSLQWRKLLGKSWEVELEGHGAASRHEDVAGDKLTGAAEVRYRGDLPSGITLNGAGYFSDAYFPGNRKGTVSFTQGIVKRIKDDLNLSGSIGYNRTAPKSYAYNYSYESENSHVNAALSLPRWGRFSTSLNYSHRGEASSSYSMYLDEGPAGSEKLRMNSHRLGGQWRWQSSNAKHSLFGTLEGGFFADPIGNDRPTQSKASLNYSYQWLTANVSYQKGSFYLYEYMMSSQQDRDFYRFTSSASINKDLSKEVSLSSSMNFTRDTYQGNVPSVNLTANYFPRENLGLFLNAYWYQYRFMNTSNIFNVQVGVTWNFSKARPSSGKKSNITARVYYDHNANGKYDEGDKPADGYLLNLDEKVFISDEEGKVRYSRVPYGEYSLKPTRAGRWFFDQKKVPVNRARTTVDIPLKQSGTLRGGIRYEIGENSVEINPRYEGVQFTVSNDDKSFTQTIVTDGQGRFTTFLPVGEYTLTLNEKTLIEHTYCDETTVSIKIEAGKVSQLEPFVIKVQERRVNVRRFFSE